MAGMGMIKQNNARKAERALNEILDKADSNANGRVELKDFIDILEANGVEVTQNKCTQGIAIDTCSRWMKVI